MFLSALPAAAALRHIKCIAKTFWRRCGIEMLPPASPLRRIVS
jgi:hypothetical protein